MKNLTRGANDTGLKGELLYARGHGYDPALVSVVFKDDRVLIERVQAGSKAKPHEWRQAGHTASSCDEDENSSTPPPIPAANPFPIHSVGDHRPCACCSPLISRIEKLENALGTRSFVSDDLSSLLSVLRTKLGTRLDMPLGSQEERASADRGAHRVVQERLHVQADCSLGILERMAIRTCRMMPNESHCIPSFAPGIQLRPQTTKFTIVFSTYFALCRFLNISSSVEVRDSLIKVKTKRNEKVPIVSRVVGSLLCPDAHSRLPLVISVGHSMPPTGERSMLIPVLTRKDTTWDEVDKMYEHELEGQHMLASEILTQCNLDGRHSEDSDGASRSCTAVLNKSQIGSFALTWTRVSKIQACATFQNFEPTEVHGTLQADVPYVMFRGHHDNSEVASILTEEFISSAMPNRNIDAA